ncbi:MAG: hypothetical protein V3S94_07430 [Gammaproteobacteria bacterium]
MARDLKAKIRLTADTKQANAALKKTQTGLASLGTSLVSGAVAFGAFTKAITFAVKASIEQQRVIAQLDNQLKSLGPSAESVSKALQDQASALQRVSTFGDEAIIQSQAIIASFTKEQDQIEALTAATIDFAAAKGVDLNIAADLVAKSFGSSTNALSRYGVEVEGAAGSTERLLQLTTGLAELFGGAAIAEANTFGGQLERLSGSLTDTAEKFGDAATQSEGLGGALEFAINGIQDFNDEVDKTPNKASLLGRAVDALFNPFLTFSTALLTSRLDALVPWGAAVDDAAESLDTLSDSIGGFEQDLKTTDKAVEATKDALRALGVVLDEDVNAALDEQADLLKALDLTYQAGKLNRDEFERSEAAIAQKVRELNGDLETQQVALQISETSSLSYAEALQVARAELDLLSESELRNADVTVASVERRIAVRERERGTQTIFGQETTAGGTFSIPDGAVVGANGRVTIGAGPSGRGVSAIG